MTVSALNFLLMIYCYPQMDVDVGYCMKCSWWASQAIHHPLRYEFDPGGVALRRADGDRAAIRRSGEKISLGISMYLLYT